MWFLILKTHGLSKKEASGLLTKLGLETPLSNIHLLREISFLKV